MARKELGIAPSGSTDIATKSYVDSGTATVTNKDLSSGTNTFPTFNQNTTGTAAGLSATLVVGSGGTGATTLTGLVKGNGTSAMTAVSAPTGTVVGTSDTQALTNKDLSGAGNTFPTFNQSTTGNAATATKLATARAINGVNFDGSAAITNRLDQLSAPTASVSMGSQNLINVADPSGSQDAATKNYVDASVQGLQVKPTATVVATSALPAGTYANGTSGVGATFTVTATGTTTVDGHVLAANDLVLVTAQASAFQNGLYKVTTAGTTGVSTVLTRHVDMDQAAEFSGAFVAVGNTGTANLNSLWLANPSTPVTVGTTSIPFTELNRATDLAQGTGITLSGNTVSIDNSVVATLSGTQALTNKDLTGSGNTFPTFNQNTTGTAASLSATLAVNKGGTGATSLTGLILGNGTSAFTTVTAPAGTVVGTSDTQALTHKDLTDATNTFPTLNQNTTGSAAKLTTARTIQTNLASTSTASFDGSANIAPGVTGTLPVGNGGTGQTSLTSLSLTTPTVTGYTETVQPLGTVGSTKTIPALSGGTMMTCTLTSGTPCTFTMPTAASGLSFILVVEQPASGTATTATFTGVKWPSAGAPVITGTLGKADALTFFCPDGSNWWGSYVQGYTY